MIWCELTDSELSFGIPITCPSAEHLVFQRRLAPGEQPPAPDGAPARLELGRFMAANLSLSSLHRSSVSPPEPRIHPNATSRASSGCLLVLLAPDFEGVFFLNWLGAEGGGPSLLCKPDFWLRQKNTSGDANVNSEAGRGHAC